MAAVKYWLWLASQSRVSARAKAALIAHYGGAEEAFFAPSGEYARLPGLTERDAALLEARDLGRVMPSSPPVRRWEWMWSPCRTRTIPTG